MRNNTIFVSTLLISSIGTLFCLKEPERLDLNALEKRRIEQQCRPELYEFKLENNSTSHAFYVEQDRWQDNACSLSSFAILRQPACINGFDIEVHVSDSQQYQFDLYLCRTGNLNKVDKFEDLEPYYAAWPEDDFYQLIVRLPEGEEFRAFKGALKINRFLSKLDQSGVAEYTFDEIKARNLCGQTVVLKQGHFQIPIDKQSLLTETELIDLESIPYSYHYEKAQGRIWTQIEDQGFGHFGFWTRAIKSNNDSFHIDAHIENQCAAASDALLLSFSTELSNGEVDARVDLNMQYQDDKEEIWTSQGGTVHFSFDGLNTFVHGIFPKQIMKNMAGESKTLHAGEFHFVVYEP